MNSTWHSPYILVYKDPLLTYLLISVPSILTFRYHQLNQQELPELPKFPPLTQLSWHSTQDWNILLVGSGERVSHPFLWRFVMPKLGNGFLEKNGVGSEIPKKCLCHFFAGFVILGSKSNRMDSICFYTFPKSVKHMIFILDQLIFFGATKKKRICIIDPQHLVTSVTWRLHALWCHNLMTIVDMSGHLMAAAGCKDDSLNVFQKPGFCSWIGKPEAQIYRRIYIYMIHIYIYIHTYFF